MTLHHVRSQIEFTSDNPSDADDDFDAFVDAFEHALINLADRDSRLVDPNTAGSLRDRWVNVLMGVDASSKQEAAQAFSDTVRTALSEVECETPDWPSFRHSNEPTSELV